MGEETGKGDLGHDTSRETEDECQLPVFGTLDEKGNGTAYPCAQASKSCHQQSIHVAWLPPDKYESGQADSPYLSRATDVHQVIAH